ncbi:MAG: phage tail protein [Pseudomonadota bacterium]
MFNVAIDATDVLYQFGAMPAQAERATKRALTLTAKWIDTQGSRAIAKASGVPLKALKRGKGVGRVRIKSPSASALRASVWFGLMPVKAAYVGKLSQLKKGARAGKHVFPGGFVGRMPSGHIGIYLRKGKARLPIVEQSVKLEQAQTILEGVASEAGDVLQQKMAHELNYEMNVRGK